MTEPFDSQPRRVSLALPLNKPVVTWVLLGIIVVVFALETLAGGSTNSRGPGPPGRQGHPPHRCGRVLAALYLHVPAHRHHAPGLQWLCPGRHRHGAGAPRWAGGGSWPSTSSPDSLAAWPAMLSATACRPAPRAPSLASSAPWLPFSCATASNWVPGDRRRLANIAFLIVINLVLGFTQPGIDNMAHLGGLVSGFCLGWFLMPTLQTRSRRHAAGGRRTGWGGTGRPWPWRFCCWRAA